MAVAGTLLWLRFPRLRVLVVVMVTLLVVLGILFPAIYEFAGGEAEWSLSGGSRLTLIERVIEVTLRNPITGLGPAAYRPYANMKPLPYLGAYWVAPLINSHNNYVDLFAHVGLLGLGLFFWFCFAVARLGLRLRIRYREGFAAGYVNGMLAAGGRCAGHHGPGRLDAPLRLQHRLLRLPGQRAGVVVPGRVGGAGEHRGTRARGQESDVTVR